MSEMPISEASGHLDEVADESAATGEVIYLTRDGRRLAAIVPAELAAESRQARMPPTLPPPRRPWLSPARTSRPKWSGPLQRRSAGHHQGPAQAHPAGHLCQAGVADGRPYPERLQGLS